MHFRCLCVSLDQVIGMFEFVCINVTSDNWSYEARFLVKNIFTQRKPLNDINTISVSLSKNGHDFRKKSGSKIEVRKKCFLQKMVS